MKKHKIEDNKKLNKENIADTLQIPKDILMGCSILNVLGNREVHIENYKGILEYTEEYIFLQGKNEKIRIEGKNLSIDYYSNEDMRIVGNISIIRYL